MSKNVGSFDQEYQGLSDLSKTASKPVSQKGDSGTSPGSALRNKSSDDESDRTSIASFERRDLPSYYSGPCDWLSDRSVMFCVATTLLWGVSQFCFSVRAKIADTTARPTPEPLPFSISLTVLTFGVFVAVIIVGATLSYHHGSTEILTKRIPKRNFFAATLNGVFGAMAFACYGFAADTGIPGSVEAPISSLYLIFPPIFGMIVYKRTLTKKVGFGMVCSVLSAVALSGWLPYSHLQKITTYQFGIVMLAVLGYSLNVIVAEPAAKGLDTSQFFTTRVGSLIGFAIAALSFALFYDHGWKVVFDVAEWRKFDTRLYLLTILATALGMLGAACFVFCLASGGDGRSMNKMVAISSMYTVVSAVLSILFLHEKLTVETVFGLTFAMVGIVLLSTVNTNSDVEFTEFDARTPLLESYKTTASYKTDATFQETDEENNLRHGNDDLSLLESYRSMSHDSLTVDDFPAHQL